MLRRCLAWAKVSLVFVASATAQQAQAPIVPKYNLQAGDETPLGNLPAVATMAPIKCDAKGNIYVRFYQPRVFSAPIRKFTLDGENKAVYSTDNVKGWEGAEIIDYALAHDGQVYLLVDQLTDDKKLETGILTFDDAGHSLSSTRINFSLDSFDHLEVFSTGEFLVTGYRKVEEPPQQIPGTPPPKDEARQKLPKDPPAEPATFVVSRGGDLINEVLFLTGPSSGKPSDGEPRLRVTAGAVMSSATVAGDDGNIYVMFQSDKPTVYAISANGEVVRTFKVEPPSEKSTAFAMTLASGVGLLLKTAEKNDRGSYPADQTWLSLINPETGERMFDYQLSAQVGSALACYTPRGFFFLGGSKGRLVIRKASWR